MRPETLGQFLRVVVVVESGLAHPRSAAQVVEAALAGGARTIQLRNKGASARELCALGSALQERVQAAGGLFFVNDRLDVALALGADGVHLGPDDPPVAAVRKASPDGFLIGRSADDPDVARHAVRDGADYIGCGTVFATGTKTDAGAVIGVDGLRSVVESVSAPVVGIGGITQESVASVMRSGAAGVAVVGAIMRATDPKRATESLLSACAAESV